MAFIQRSIYVCLFNILILIPIFSYSQPTNIEEAVAKGAPPATIIVTDPGDAGPNTLRQAVLDSNPGDTIEFNLPGMFPHTITLTSGEILINKALTINGLGKEDLIISGNNNSRVFNIDDGIGSAITVVITNLTIRDGDARIPAAPPITSTRGAPPVNQKGGGIYNVENLTLEDCIMTNNVSGGDVDGGGGALATRGGLVFIRRCHFLSNRDEDFSGADSFGGAIDMQAASVIDTGFLLIEDSKFDDNSAQSLGEANGGAIYIGTGGFATNPPSNISRTSFTNNFTQADTARGGGIHNDSGRLRLTDIVVLGNIADGQVEGTGGGIYTFQQGSSLAFLDLLNGTVSQNNVEAELARGGGLYFRGSNSSTQINSITNGTISENVAEANSGFGIPEGYGGAIFNDDARIDLLASTVAFNEVRGPDGSDLSGAAFFSQGSLPSLRYRNNLIVGNFFTQSGGARSSQITTRGPGAGILLVPNCANAFGVGSPAQVYQNNGTSNITDSDNMDDQCALNFNPDFDPSSMLGPLQNNGGFTLTHELIDTPSPTNPAIDAIPDGDCTNEVQPITRKIDDPFSPNLNQFYFANSYESYPYFGLSFEPLYVDHDYNKLANPVTNGSLDIYTENVIGFESDLATGLNALKIDVDNDIELKGLPPMENVNDGRPFPRPFDWFNTGTALCDVGSFELQVEGTITVEKISNPPDTTGFIFEGTDFIVGCDLNGTFTLDDGESTSGCILPEGTYTVEETDNQGLPFLIIDCNNPSAQVNIDEPNSIVTIAIINDGDEAFCTFTNSVDPILTVVHQGTGTGVSISNPTGIDCPNDNCMQDFAGGTNVTLTATPDTGSVFDGWSGDCPATSMSDTTITLNANSTCIATFSLLPTVMLDVIVNGPGTGGVTSNPSGQIDCSNFGSADCDETYNVGEMVTLTATPQPGSLFVNWTGDSECTGDPANPVLSLTMNTDISCEANFSIQQVMLDVIVNGPGTGGVISNPSGQINCSNTGATNCDETYNIGSTVTLTAVADPGSIFTGWSGDSVCTGDPLNPDFTLTMNMDISCEATFIITPRSAVTLNVVIQGPGTCTVTSSPNVINCPGDCSESFDPPGVTVDLMANPDPNSTFVDWTGDCDDLNPDTSITVNEDSTCIATCVLSEFVLNPIFPALDDNINFISAEAATAGGNVAFAWSKRQGNTFVGGRVCNGIEVGLANPKVLAIVRANDLGVATHIFYIPLFGDFEFGVQLQAVDIETCRTSNVVPQIIRKDESG